MLFNDTWSQSRPHLDLPRCPLLHKSLQPPVLRTYRVVIQPESLGCPVPRDNPRCSEADSLVAQSQHSASLTSDSFLWGNVSSQIHLISPGCPRPNSALTVHKSGLKHRSSIHPSYTFSVINIRLFPIVAS